MTSNRFDRGGQSLAVRSEQEFEPRARRVAQILGGRDQPTLDRTGVQSPTQNTTALDRFRDTLQVGEERRDRHARRRRRIGRARRSGNGPDGVRWGAPRGAPDGVSAGIGSIRWTGASSVATPKRQLPTPAARASHQLGETRRDFHLQTLSELGVGFLGVDTLLAHVCHSSAPFFHAYMYPTTRMKRKTSISINPNSASRSSATAHGNMKIVSTSKITNSIAIR